VTSDQVDCDQVDGRDRDLTGRVALVTGASRGIGRAIALTLLRLGARLFVVGRDRDSLDEVVASAPRPSNVTSFQINLTAEEDLQPLIRHLETQVGKVDILIHSAGAIHQDPMARADIADLDLQYKTNVRAPYLLTQRLLPLLVTACGQVVFINSSVGLAAKRPEIGQYAATKHALKAIADSLREEVNPKGIRVLTVYLGRTATPMQESLYRQEGKVYQPEMLIQPEDVASVVAHALMLPRTAEVTDISIRPMVKTSA